MLILADIEAIYQGLKTIRTKRIPSRMGFVINHNFSKLEPVVGNLSESIRRLVDEYAIKDEKGVPIQENGNFVIPEAEIYAKEIDELLGAEVDITFDKVLMEDIESCDSNQKFDSLTPEELAVLEKML